MRLFILVVASTILTLTVAAQDRQWADGRPKPRVFITDSKSWEVSSAGGGTSEGFGGGGRGGARPQTAEIIKTFSERCPSVVVNNKQEKADYVVLLDHEGGKGWFAHDNKVAVFNHDGDSIVSHSTVSLGNSVKDACEAIMKDWPGRASKIAAEAQSAETAAVEKTGAQASACEITVSSVPPSADIEVDGNFVGSTPSTIEVAPGDHSVTIKKAGFRTWERKLKATGGAINLSAELEKAD